MEDRVAIMRFLLFIFLYFEDTKPLAQSLLAEFIDEPQIMGILLVCDEPTDVLQTRIFFEINKWGLTVVEHIGKQRIKEIKLIVGRVLIQLGLEILWELFHGEVLPGHVVLAQPND